MKLYYSPGACSLAAHIALRQGGVPFDIERVDLKTRTTASGSDFLGVTAKGYVPALKLDDGQIVTENVAVLDYLAGTLPQLGVDGPLGRTRLLEALVYISTELHKSFKPFWKDGGERDKAAASAYVTARLQYLADTTRGDYLFGDRPSIADFYLFVIMLWAGKFGVTIPERLVPLRDRLKSLPAVRQALQAEGLLQSGDAAGQRVAAPSIAQ